MPKKMSKKASGFYRLAKLRVGLGWLLACRGVGGSGAEIGKIRLVHHYHLASGKYVCAALCSNDSMQHLIPD